MGPTSSRFRPVRCQSRADDVMRRLVQSREQLWRARSRRGSGFAGTVESTSSRGTYSVQGDRAGAARRGVQSQIRRRACAGGGQRRGGRFMKAVGLVWTRAGGRLEPD
ncbi:hypothetical protein CERSUDRAFT_101503 [Gelatoporia subvermispora B]|uniref:Uncharacterized protein n=1 Tax=Ceriporiopsis subvermispora (strain B) TaxID=914234 RepID=M2QEA1_CERS8|nr:hypothetical protein CERSUDRAFT_101503 [Gelatoporia subvermispora B]